MMKKEFCIEDLNLKYHVGINQVNFDFDIFLMSTARKNKKEALNQLFKILDDIQNRFKGSIIQLFNDKFLLNQEHLFTACYFFQKAFYGKKNISNKKNIELLLYLSTSRQISRSIDAFGIKIENLENKILSYCIISPTNNLDDINKEIIGVLNLSEIEVKINEKSLEKYERIKEFFTVSNNQIESVINSYDTKKKNKHTQQAPGLEVLFAALHDLICEKMALLSLEK